MDKLTQGALLLALAANTTPALAAVAGDTSDFRSPDGVLEHCVAIAHMPGGVYSDDDRSLERAYCDIDFYADDTALCPKTWSTSPGTMVYDLEGSAYAGERAAFEHQVCAHGFRAEMKAGGQPLAYKLTMNGKDTSGTFSTASLLYYHFSRYLDSAMHVPVSVYRSMDRKAHQQRVARRGLALSAHSRAKHMNHSAWGIVDRAESNPSSYHPTDELFTADRKAIYGILIHPRGARYSAAVNGSRKSGWGAGQSKDFQQTAPYRALRSDKPLAAAIKQGLSEARRHHAKGADADPRQIAWWMQDLIELTFLDYIFSQQDRIGNIDYLSYWHWVENGELKRKLAKGPKVPADIAGFKPVRLKRTWLNDNDAGGRLAYANFTKKTGMLEKQRHYNPGTYRLVMALQQDFAAQGELYAYVRDSFGLSKKQFQMVVKNTRLATDILRSNCEAGKLHFDLDPEAFFKDGKVTAEQVDCAG